MRCFGTYPIVEAGIERYRMTEKAIIDFFLVARIKSGHLERTLPKDRRYKTCHPHRRSMSESSGWGSSWPVDNTTTLNVLEEFAKYLKYVRNLDFFETPNVSERRMQTSFTGGSLLVRVSEEALQRSDGLQKLCMWLQFRLGRENAEISQSSKRSRSSLDRCLMLSGWLF